MNTLQFLAQVGESVKARMRAVRIHPRQGREGIRGRVADILARGSNIHARDEDGNTALMYAVGSGDAELVRLLVRAGAEVDAANERGMTPLMYAVHRGIAGEPVLRTLLAAGADPRQATTDGDTAYAFAEDSDNTLALSLFREYARHA